MDHAFTGSAICQVGIRGDIALPASFCITITSRSANRGLYIGLHEYLNCLVVYDRVVLNDRIDRFERRRIAEGGTASAEQLEHLRRNTGFAAPADLDGKGRVSIAPWLDERRGEAHRVLVVGMGHSFEVWDLDYVLNHGHRDLQRLANLHLDFIAMKATKPSKGTSHAHILHPVGAFGGGSVAGEPGLPLQPLRALQPRHDPIIGIDPR